MMKRDPSIHITQSQLAELLQEVYKECTFTDLKPKEFANRILEKAKTKSIASRSIVVTNDKLLRQTERVKLASRSNASLFAATLLLVRRKHKHRGIQLIKPGDIQWLEIKDICNLATEFSNEFGIPLKAGYLEYCELGLKLMKTFYLSRFKTIHGTICSEYEAKLKIMQDKWPSITESIYNYYLKKVNERIGWVSENYKEFPQKYVCFVKVQEECKRIGVVGKVYIDAQFAGLEWANAIPDPCQLTGAKAMERLMKYCYENNIKVSKKEAPKIDFTKIRKNAKNNS